MRTIQTKIISLILIAIISCAVVIGGAGIISASKAINQDSTQILKLTGDKHAEDLNSMFVSLEKSVETLSIHSALHLEYSDKLISDEDYRNQYTEEIEQLAINVAKNTEGVCGVYLRYNPEVLPSDEGFFFSKVKGSEEFQEQKVTELSKNSESVKDSQVWYYKTVENGNATWIPPYVDEQTGSYVISYVIPFYKNNQLLGVIGMDIDFYYVEENIEQIEIYESGTAFLTDEQGNVIYHEKLAYGTALVDVDESLIQMQEMVKNNIEEDQLYEYKWNNEKKLMLYEVLENDMRLFITAPVKEINAQRNELFVKILLELCIIVVVFVIIAIVTGRRIVRPIKELNEAAKRVAKGDLDVTLSYKGKDEIGTLGESFKETVSHLRKYISYINELAYRDSMTGVKNKTAYIEAVKNIENKMRMSEPVFGVIVLDVNELKSMNDSYGHDFGDMMIINASKMICNVFKHSPVFRIGGDEFVVILENEDYENHQQLLERFQQSMEERNEKATDPREQIKIARGVAIYNPNTDVFYDHVFKRADEAMYANKAMMKDKTEN